MVLRNYSPVSSLPFLGMLVERGMMIRPSISWLTFLFWIQFSLGFAMATDAIMNHLWGQLNQGGLAK